MSSKFIIVISPLTGNGYNSGLKKRNKIVKLTNESLRCYSRAPSTMTAKFVPCANFNEYQLKSKFLFYPDPHNVRNARTSWYTKW